MTLTIMFVRFVGLPFSCKPSPGVFEQSSHMPVRVHFQMLYKVMYKLLRYLMGATPTLLILYQNMYVKLIGAPQIVQPFALLASEVH
jgi:hypothetical protein